MAAKNLMLQRFFKRKFFALFAFACKNSEEILAPICSWLSAVGGSSRRSYLTTPFT